MIGLFFGTGNALTQDMNATTKTPATKVNTMDKLNGSQLINLLASACEVLADVNDDDDTKAGRFIALSESLAELGDEYAEELVDALNSAIDVGLVAPQIESGTVGQIVSR